MKSIAFWNKIDFSSFLWFWIMLFWINVDDAYVPKCQKLWKYLQKWKTKKKMLQS